MGVVSPTMVPAKKKARSTAPGKISLGRLALPTFYSLTPKGQFPLLNNNFHVITQ